MLSQYGEDDIISSLIDYSMARVCCEIGAGDGLHISNTALFWQDGWRAVLCEADERHRPSLIQNTRGHDVEVVMQEATPHNVNGIVPEDCSVLSIDIDGDDYYLWEALDRRPDIVCIEFNPTIPYWMDIVGERGARYGASVAALLRLAHDKGYFLVAATHCNLIFSTNPSDAIEPDLESLIGRESLTYLTTNYDGKAFPIGPLPFGFTC